MVRRYSPQRGPMVVFAVGGLASLAGLTLLGSLAGAGESSFQEMLVLYLFLVPFAVPLFLAIWRLLVRPELVFEPGALLMMQGRTLFKSLPRAEIETIEAHELDLSRFVVARMRSGEEITLLLPIELRLPLMRDPAFDARVAGLHDWLQASVDP